LKTIVATKDTGTATIAYVAARTNVQENAFSPGVDGWIHSGIHAKNMEIDIDAIKAINTCNIIGFIFLLTQATPVTARQTGI
jgi:hypothetical protein